MPELRNGFGFGSGQSLIQPINSQSGGEAVICYLSILAFAYALLILGVCAARLGIGIRRVCTMPGISRY